MPACKVSKCERSVHSRQMCNMHYRRLLKNGTTDLVPKVRKLNPRKNCKVEECGELSTSLGYCRKHYTRFKSTGDPRSVKKIARIEPGRPCLVEGCKRKVVATNLCSVHWQRNRNHGNPLAGGAYVLTTKAIDHDDSTRTCPECLRRLPLETSFHADRRSPSGFRARCNECHTAQVKNWYRANSDRQRKKAVERTKRDGEKIRERDRKRYEKDKPKRLELASKQSQVRRARKAKTEIDRGISKNALRKIHGDFCHYCARVMNFEPATKRKYLSDHATIEHLVPLSRGGTHTWDNCVLACRACNISKNAKSIEAWQDWKNL